MFRKKKGSDDGEGYNRISRMIEDRRRELGDSEDEQQDSDTIQFGLADDKTTATDEGEAVSLLDVRSPYRSASPLGAGETTGETGSERPLQARWNSPPPLEYDPEPDEQQQHEEAVRAPERQTPAADTMRVPDIGRAMGGASLVASDASWEGKLISTGDVRVEGTVRGEIQTDATLIVAPNARVHASIRARNIMLAGDVEGDITCDERLEILPGGSARGQINSAKLVVHEGAYIDSRFQMRRDDAAV